MSLKNGNCGCVDDERAATCLEATTATIDALLARHPVPDPPWRPDPARFCPPTCPTWPPVEPDAGA